MAKLSENENEFAFSALEDSRFLLFGGENLPEPTVIYWNFVTDSLSEAREKMHEWEARKFPRVEKYF